MKNSYTPKNLPIENLKWESFVHLIGKANAEIARFDGLLQTIPNPSVLLSPLATNEAVLSSRIEGTQATLKEVLEYEANPQKEAKKYEDIQEVINYRKALKETIDEMEKFSLSTRVIKKAHEILLQGVRGANKDRGNFRRQQVFIGKSGATIEQVTYVPPSAEKISDLMSNLEKYIHSDDKDLLVQLAIVHAQFEMIHPFMDGNGRVGRMMLPLFLYFKKAIFYPSFYLSEYLESHRDEYYRALLDISENNNWEGWITFFLQAVAEQSKENIAKAKKIINLYGLKKQRITELTKSQFSIKILDALFVMPIFQSGDFIKISKIPRDSAFKLLRKLEENQVIVSNNKKKNRLYFFRKLLDIVK
ncbi:MAG: cell filamentation protein Fic [Candidatus Tagabacteria bacterium CG09_land_8_20_14_0_10_41_14]|uniref:Cell filamentation protein Fic n=1 Tax=Candidatus Tagabacteria bacterium CG09_land_8_20_14_0_10_41_14 TaxID=1975021 RepID=A0A2H0WLM5_9BACT|nr:MAG: cell filamentation protein Fic [Candidatus Tagabacteria bacterium CG09_land_8_20_14_0_10_41_14]